MSTGEPDDPDERQLREHAAVLGDAVHDALPRWVEASVESVLAGAERTFDDGLRRQASQAGQAAQRTVGAQVRELLRQDIDEQRTTPLSLLRAAVSYPTAVLKEAGVDQVSRDATDERLFPDDIYDLTPAAFADIDSSLHEPGMAWGAAKAFVHLKRRRSS